MSKKSICKNCGDPVGDDRSSDEFCSGQCRVEYELEHDRK
jgi:predicted nucleic acid-binding Zn ribbon protein